MLRVDLKAEVEAIKTARELTPMQIVVLRHYLGLGVPPMTFNDLAEALDATTSHLHVICSTGLTKLGSGAKPSEFKKRLWEARVNDARICARICVAAGGSATQTPTTTGADL